MSRFEILDKVESMLPKDAMIVDTLFEGANIVLYSKNKKFVVECAPVIKGIVNSIKKRVELRASSSILLDVVRAEKVIRDIVPAEADIREIWFDEKRSIVVIEALKPGIVVGKGGEFVKRIVEKTLWSPILRRSPAINSDLIKTIRLSLYKNSDYRRKFLNGIGEKIYSGFERNKNYWIRLSALGGAREVGRSCFLLQTPESRILLDCGINVASDDESFPHLEAPELDIKNLDAVIITHSHLDHCGLVPFLYKFGYRGPVYVTEPTRDVVTLLCIDFINVVKREGKNGLYSINDIKEMVKHTVSLEYGEVTDVSPDVRLTFFNAGHVLGSAIIHLNIGNGFHNLIYTGDLKVNPSRLLPPAQSQFQRAETVMIESTYGGKMDVNPPRLECEKVLVDMISETISRGGKVLIPVLGVGRAQEIMIILEDFMSKKKIPEIPIFVDGMVWDVTAIHTAYPEFFNRDVSSQIFSNGPSPFLNPIFKRVGGQQERVKVVEETGPCVILATSGMLVGGPSVFYLESLADNSRNRLIFVSYQGPGSLGHKVQDGAKDIVKVIGKKVQTIPIKLSVDTLRGFSGHADRNELVAFFTKLRPQPRRVIIVHGEKAKTLELAGVLHQRFRVETSAPRNLDALRIR